MGNQGLGAAISLAAGLVAGAAVIALSGGTLTPVVLLYAGMAFSAASIGAGIVTSQLMGTPKANNSQDAIAQGLQISNANESYPIPVIFGTQRLAGNYLRYEKSQFTNKKITSTIEAGKGGQSGGSDSQTVGFRYFLAFEYGLCMGPVDYIHDVISNPGEKSCFDNPRAIDEVSEEMSLRTPRGDQKGDIILYRGDNNQGRNGGASDPYDAEGMRYRHVCWVLFKKGFEIGLQPIPQTYVFELTRWPKVAGTGIKPRGSDNDSDSAYWSANPAAILYEIFTNAVWGRGLDSNLLDLASFVEVSQYFEDKKIGMSFTMEGNATLSDTVDSIRMHVNTIVYWMAGKLFCRCLMDTEHSYQDMITITSDEVVGSPELTRPLWNATFNELRCEFVNRHNRYQPETVFVQDLGNIDTVGVINSKKIGLRGFIDRSTAQRQANRILREISYPAATCRMFINRMNSRLVPGDFVKFVWSEWSAGTVTSYWRVVSISDENQDERGLELVLVEDQYKPAKEGEEDDFENPIEAWSDTDAVGDEAEENEDAYLPFEAGEITPIAVRDLNIIMANHTARYAVFAQKRSGAALSVNIFLGEEGSGDFTDKGTIPCWAITGTTSSAIPGATHQIDRTKTFDGILNNTDDLADLLEAASIVQLDADDFDVLTRKRQALLLVENEVIQIGYATESSGTVTFRNYIRGVYGTSISPHDNGTSFVFIPLYTSSDYTQKYDSSESYLALDWKGIGVTADGFDEDSEATFELPEAHHKLKQRGLRPFPPEVLSKSIDGGDWKIVIRPRFHHKGAGIGRIDEWLEQETDSLDGYTFPITPDTLTSPTEPTSTVLSMASGKVVLRYPSAGVTSFKVYASLAGKRSETFKTV